jgi:proline dehydrogenase
MCMTPRSRTKADPHRATVYGERIDELLPAMAAICSSGRVLKAGGDAGYDQDMLSLSLTLPPSAGGSVRRALLRSQAEILRRQADAVGTHAPAAACVHCCESEAMRAVAERLQHVARALGISGTTIAERALLLGQITAAAPCRCRAGS